MKNRQYSIEENANLKTKAKNYNSEEIKENYKLITELRNIHSSLIALIRQHDRMKKIISTSHKIF